MRLRLWTASDSLRAGLTAGWPLGVPTATVALSFAVAAEPVLGPVTTVLMSVLVFSGAGQFAALGVLTAGGATATAVVAGLLINARFLPMGMALAPSLPGRSVWSAAALVDASWAIAHQGNGRFDVDRMVGATIIQYVAWVAGTAAGVVLPEVDRVNALGLDAVLPAFYVALLLPEVREGDKLVTAALAAVITWVTLPAVPPGVPVLVGACACVLGLVRR